MSAAALAWESLPQVRDWSAGALVDDWDELLGGVVVEMVSQGSPPSGTPVPEGRPTELGTPGDGDDKKDLGGMAGLIVATAFIVLGSFALGFAAGYYVGCRFCGPV